MSRTERMGSAQSLIMATLLRSRRNRCRRLGKKATGCQRSRRPSARTIWARIDLNLGLSGISYASTLPKNRNGGIKSDSVADLIARSAADFVITRFPTAA